MLLQTNSYIVPKDKRAEHARLLRRFRQTLQRLGCDHFECYEQVGPNWTNGESTGRFVQIMRFRDRKHQLSVQSAERTDTVAQGVIAEFCELVNFPYQQQQGLFAVGFYTSVLPVSTRAALARQAEVEALAAEESADDAQAAADAEAAAGEQAEAPELAEGEVAEEITAEATAEYADAVPEESADAEAELEAEAVPEEPEAVADAEEPIDPDAPVEPQAPFMTYTAEEPEPDDDAEARQQREPFFRQ